MAQYKLHCFCQSGNSYKVALYLNCAGLDWEPVFVDFFKGATRDPQVARERQRDGRGAGAGDGGKKLTQSGAILTYLAETTGKFAPADEERGWRRCAGSCSTTTSSPATSRPTAS